MRFLKAIQVKQCGPTCQTCAQFLNDPALIEQIYPGLTAMSSGYASVRANDGLCRYHGLYLSAGDSCKEHTVGVEVVV